MIVKATFINFDDPKKNDLTPRFKLKAMEYLIDPETGFNIPVRDAEVYFNYVAPQCGQTSHVWQEGKLWRKEAWECKKIRDDLESLKASLASRDTAITVRKAEILELRTEINDLRAEIAVLRKAFLDTLAVLERSTNR
jgi:hypothetical protein